MKKIEELHKSVKPPQCNSDFMNKIEVRCYIVPPTCPWQSIAFELISIFVLLF